MDVAKAIADWYKGIDVRKKLYKLFLNNSIDFIFNYKAWQVDKEIAKTMIWKYQLKKIVSMIIHHH